MTSQAETLDLSLREGVVNYIQDMLCADVRKAHQLKGAVQPFGVALQTVINGKQLPRPQAHVVGAYGMDTRNVKRTLRNTAKNGAATGVLLVQLRTVNYTGSTKQAQVVTVQLEHREFGDLVWIAPIGADGKIGEFGEPVDPADCRYEIKPTKLLPGRWMN